MTSINKKTFTILIGGFLIGVILTIALASTGVFRKGSKDSRSSGVVYFTQDNLGYFFIKPLLNVEYVDQEDSLRQFPLLAKTKKLVEEEVKNNPEVEIAVYFNDLSNAGWFGIDEDKKFVPASLLKLPMLISYYKLRETELDLFGKQIFYQGQNYNSDRNTAEASIIEPGHTYTVKELLDSMIIDSDNNALELLYQFRKDALREVFEDLQAPLPETRDDIASKDFLSPKEMSKFFLVLYHGSYLKKGDSNEALELLSKTKYKNGLVAGVPSDIIVSHKYGERKIVLEDGNVANEFHDCGIFYYTKSPYKLCIMTKANNLSIEKASEIIANVSKTVYQSIAGGK